MSEARILEGDCLNVLSTLPERSVQTCITSPPYFGLRDYGTGTWAGGDDGCDHKRRVIKQDGLANVPCARGAGGAMVPAGGRKARESEAEVSYGAECGKCGATRTDSQIGLEETPEQYVANLVAVFREVRRVLRDDGTLWLNLGDSYAQYDGQGNLDEPREPGLHGAFRVSSRLATVAENRGPGRHSLPPGLKRKDLIGIPWMVAFALRADGWYLRSDIIWAKPNPMPESVTDRPTKAHEYLFMLSKFSRYFWDADAIREDNEHPDRSGTNPRLAISTQPGNTFQGRDGRAIDSNPAGRNKRSVWTVATQPFPGAHFATFPPKLIEPCVLAGSSPQACAECGAPWERVTERERTTYDGRRATTPARDTGVAHGNYSAMDRNMALLVRTKGWQPSCEHDAPGRCTVLDPFSGAGTTGVVALRHDRDYIGIELNPAYAQMARDRIYDDGPLLNLILGDAA
jgi:DNA modification methylase